MYSIKLSLKLSTINNTMSSDNEVKITEVETVFQLVENIKNKPMLKVQLGHNTDIGGSRVNQDRHSVLTFPEHDVYAIAVADGHSHETGHHIADITKNCLENLLKNRITELIENPVTFLEFCCDYIHEEIRKELVKKMEREGYKIYVDGAGVISKVKSGREIYEDVKGGTTFSIVILIGKKLYIANLGDSTGLLCCKTPILKPSNIKYEKDAANPTKVISSCDIDSSLSTYIELTREHSPENVEEYIRMRDFKCSDENANHAELLCVYDDQHNSCKYTCPHVFNISETGTPTVREDAAYKYYYKNLRKEKATYVCERYSNSVLSITRALGDYKFQNLGVTNKPEIQSIDLEPIFQQIDTAKVEKVDPMTVCVVLCSDGVWDNWQYDDVCKFVMDPSCLNAIAHDEEKGAERVAESFMLRNNLFATRNFGNSADNATGIIMYITQEE